MTVNNASAGNITKQTKIAAVILAYDEEKLLTDCINHLKPYVDWILVLEGHSIDRTLDIALELADQVVIRPFSGSFADERNQAHLSLPPAFNWILMCDADERFNIEFLKDIKKIIGQNDVLCFRFPRINEDKTYLDKLVNKQDHQVRLYNRQQCRWIKNVHEVLALRTEPTKLVDQYSVKELSQYPILHLRRDSARRNNILKRWEILQKEQEKPKKRSFFHVF